MGVELLNLEISRNLILLLTTKKQVAKFRFANFKKNVESKLYYIDNSKTREQTV